MRKLFTISVCILQMPFSVMALQIPHFELPQNDSMVELNITRMKIRMDEAASEKFQYWEKQDVWMTAIARQDDEGKSQRFTYFNVVDRKGEGPPDSIEFKPTDDEKVSVDVRVSPQAVAVSESSDSKMVLREAFGQQLESVFKGNSFWRNIIQLASGFDHSTGVSHSVPQKLLDDWQVNTGSVTLRDVSSQWQSRVAEFEIRVVADKFNCHGNAWVMEDDGRPVHFVWQCDSSIDGNEKTYTVKRQITRGWQYNNRMISQLSPTPVPMLHPKDTITDVAYSDDKQQLYIVSTDYKQGNSWLTGWDAQSRKPMKTISVPGSRLHLSSNQEMLFSIGINRLMQGFMADGLKPFGSVAEFDSDRMIEDSALHGFYPLTLNRQGELEIWNLGYKKRMRHILGLSDQTLLTVNQNGCLLTSTEDGVAQLYQFDLDISCGQDGLNSFCDEVSLKHLDPVTTFRIPFEGITNITHHPDKPIIGVIADNLVSGLYNYESGEDVRWKGVSLAFSKLDDWVFTDNGIYDFQGNKLDNWSPYYVFSNSHTVIDEAAGVLFQSDAHLNKVVMRDLLNGNVLTEIKAETEPVASISFKDDLLVVGSGSSVQMLDLSRMQVQRTEGEFSGIDHVFFGDQIMVLRGSHFTGAFGVKDPVNQSHLIQQRVADLAVVNDLFYYALDNIIYRVDVKTGEKIKEIEAPGVIKQFELLDDDGVQFVIQLEDDGLWLSKGDVRIELSFNSESTVLYADRKNQEFYLAGLKDESGTWNPKIPLVRRFNASGQLLTDYQPGWGDITTLVQDAEGKVWAGNDQGELRIWDRTTGLQLFRIAAHLDKINDLKLTPNGRIASAANDGTVRLWRTDILPLEFKHPELALWEQVYFSHDLSKRHPELLMTITMDKQDGFILSGSDGYYTASPGALSRASFVDGGKLLDYARFDLWLNRPDIVAKRMGYASEETIKMFQQMVAFRKSRNTQLPDAMPSLDSAPLIEVEKPGLRMAKGSIPVRWKASSETADLVRLQVWVNGVPLYGVRGSVLDGRQVSGVIDIPLGEGVNRVRIAVSDSLGMTSSPTHFSINGEGRGVAPDLYLLTIGVSDYEKSELDLKYADKDARDITQFFSENHSRFRDVHTLSLLNVDATRKAILDARKFLEKAGPDDRVVVFFAGHGFLDSRDNYYFGTTDIDPYAPERSGLSYPELISLVDGLSSRYKLLMLDTCHSGEVAPLSTDNLGMVAANVNARGFNVTRQDRSPAFEFSLEALQNRFSDLRDATGATVLSAAGGREYALEDEQWNNGVFTASVLKGLQGSSADSDGDGSVSTNELRGFVYAEVQRLTNGQQKPTARKINMELDFVLY